MSAEEKTKATCLGPDSKVDFTAMAEVWKDAYLDGLEAILKLQEENERLAKSIVRQGVAISQQLLSSYQNWIGTSWEQIPGQASTNPFVTLSRQMIQAIQAQAEPVFRTGTDVYESTLRTYETAVAGPSRKYVLDINKKVLDTVVPA